MEMDRDLRSVQEVRRLLRNAAKAQQQWGRATQEEVDRVVRAMAEAVLPRAEELAALAVEETGFGRIEDKTIKNTFAARRIFEFILPQKTAGIIHSDPERRITEIAVPMGIVAAIIPSTNPTSTTIYKTLIAVKARNGIVLSPHPAACRCIARTAEILARAAEAAGAPEALIGWMTDPVMEATQELMRHPLTAVILATGGHGLVKAAYSSGKPAFGVGPGNVPAFIERTADVELAAGHVLAGKCFDNGTICASEQAVIADRPVVDRVRDCFRQKGGYFCSADEKRLLEKLMVQDGKLNPAVVGRPAEWIAARAGFTAPAGTCALLVEAGGVGPAEPLSLEKLSPVLAFYQADGWQEACEKCIQILHYGGLGHTLTIHSQDEAVIMRFALEKPAFRILVNTPGTHGAIGFSTALTPSLTLGCGTFGNNITTDNLTATHLINIKRLAYGVIPVPFPAAGTVRPAISAPAAAPPAPRPEGEAGREAIRQLVAAALAEYLPAGSGNPPVSGHTCTAGGSCPPACSDCLDPKPMAFISEEDVRQALAEGRKLKIGAGTTLTPLARELGERHGIFKPCGPQPSAPE